jgi:hypothetical protein
MLYVTFWSLTRSNHFIDKTIKTKKNGCVGFVARGPLLKSEKKKVERKGLIKKFVHGVTS